MQFLIISKSFYDSLINYNLGVMLCRMSIDLSTADE